jgi:hypothetical protein
MYSVEHHCPEDAMCNPPPPDEIECPPELDPGAKVGGPMRAGWVRVKEQFSCYGDTCSFSSDYFCPYPGKTLGVCDEQKRKDLQGEPFDPARSDMAPGGVDKGTWVPSFIGLRADGSCSQYPGFWCNPDSCALPAPTTVNCEASPTP